jgi:hypothetical protein
LNFEFKWKGKTNHEKRKRNKIKRENLLWAEINPSGPLLLSRRPTSLSSRGPTTARPRASRVTLARRPHFVSLSDRARHGRISLSHWATCQSHPPRARSLSRGSRTSGSYTRAHRGSHVLAVWGTWLSGATSLTPTTLPSPAASGAELAWPLWSTSSGPCCATL